MLTLSNFITIIKKMADWFQRRDSEMILQYEAAAAQRVVSKTLFPLNGLKKESWISVGITFSDSDYRPDSFVKANLPTNWTMKCNQRDPRNIVIMDANQKEMGRIFVKETSYDCYESITQSF
jgi:hypothetical protein